MRKVTWMIVALTTVVVFATTASAQQPLEYKVTVKGEVVKGAPNDFFVTFSAPVQIPEVTLPAGTYVFSIIAPSVVQVSSTDRMENYALFFTAPIARPEAGEFSMTFARTLDTAPLRVATWFLPNKTTGLEFLYPAALAGDR